MKTTKRQVFHLDGSVYQYRITEAAIKNYEAAGDRKINNAMTMAQVARTLYYIACMLPPTVTEQYLADALKNGKLYTRQNRNEYSLRGIRSLLVKARREFVKRSLFGIGKHAYMPSCFLQAILLWKNMLFVILVVFLYFDLGLITRWNGLFCMVKKAVPCCILVVVTTYLKSMLLQTKLISCSLLALIYVCHDFL